MSNDRDEEWYARSEIERLWKELEDLRYVLDGVCKGVRQIAEYNTALRELTRAMCRGNDEEAVKEVQE